MSYLTNELLETFNQNGVVVIKNFWSQEKIEEIQKNIDRIKNETLKKSKGRDYNVCKSGEINTIHAPVFEDPYFKNLTQNNKIKKTIEFLLQDQMEVRVTELFLKPAKNGMKSPIHQDNAYWCLKKGIGATMWSAITKSSEKNGGVYYYLGSNEMGLLEHTSSFCPGSSQTIKDTTPLNDYNRIIYDLNPGDILIHSALTAHGSEDNNSEMDRVGWTIQFRGLSDEYDGEKKEAYLNRLKQQLIDRNQEQDDGVLVPEGQTRDGYDGK